MLEPHDTITPEWCKAERLILGCGNILLGDDGFGPGVINYLKENFKIPESISLIDAGTSVREILFDILISETYPRDIIIIDSANINKKFGEVYKVDIKDIPMDKSDYYDLHSTVTSNLLIKIKRRHRDINFHIFICQIMPNSLINPNISSELEPSVKRLSEFIYEEYISK